MCKAGWGRHSAGGGPDSVEGAMSARMASPPGGGVRAEARQGAGRTLKREPSRTELGDGRKSVHCGRGREMGQGQEERAWRRWGHLGCPSRLQPWGLGDGGPGTQRDFPAGEGRTGHQCPTVGWGPGPLKFPTPREEGVRWGAGSRLGREAHRPGPKANVLAAGPLK